jgi:7,8-dihydropterin-6-yl-methyl-4-(beta-D-ribofuranosyl)aminobenzene 5'-phosphate synthase
MDAELSLMMAEGPAIVADHAFTTGKIAQSGFEKPLGPSRDRPIAPDLNSPYC